MTSLRAGRLSKFDNSLARVARAHFHGESIGRDWNQLRKEEVYDAIIDEKSDGRFGVRVKPKQLPIGVSLSLQFGEILYQLRAALDGLIYTAAVLETGQEPPADYDKLEFPIRPTPKEFNKAKWKFGPLSEKVISIVESVQPYSGSGRPNSGIRMINELARIDRHRRLHMVGCWVGTVSVNVTPEPKRLTAITGGSLKDELEIATFEVRDENIGMDFKADVVTPVDLGIEDIPGGRLAEIIDRMIDATTDTIKMFENGFSQT